MGGVHALIGIGEGLVTALVPVIGYDAAATPGEYASARSR